MVILLPDFRLLPWDVIPIQPAPIWKRLA